VDWGRFPSRVSAAAYQRQRTDTEQTTVLGPDLAMTKADSPDPVVRATSSPTLSRSIIPGRVARLNVALNDTIPASTTFVSFTAPAGFTSTTPPVGGTERDQHDLPARAENAVFTLVVRVNL
jgi:hypothetical protein